MMNFRRLWIIVTLLLLAGLISACGLRDEAVITPEPEEEIIIPTPANTPDLETAITPQPDAPISSPVITLTVWTVPEISDNESTPGGSSLAQQFDAFNQSHPDVNLQIEHKAIIGQGSIMNYLRTGRDIAPTILPDVVVVPSAQIPSLATEELIFPLGAIEEEMMTDLFPVATEMAIVEGSLFGYPYTLNNLEHLAYDGTVITTTIPSTWDQLITLPNGRFIFPAAGAAGAELLLQFYLEQEGSLVDSEGEPLLETEPLATALSQFFGTAVNEFVVPESKSINSLNDTWRLYQTNAASVALTEAEVMLPPRLQGATSRFDLIPGLLGPFDPLVSSWVWAVSTPDPARQAIAVELISWLSSTTNLGEWSFQSRHIPSRRSAFNAWPQGDVYVSFLQGQAEVAQPFPIEANSAIMNALTVALASVLNGSETPAGAAQIAADTINP